MIEDGGAMQPLFSGPVPTDTSRAIQEALDLHPRYLRIGDHLNTFLPKGGIDEVERPVNETLQFSAILALITIFQKLEGYTDQQAAEAIQNRADWKYALHLPLSYSGFDPAWLCEFRQQAIRQPTGMAPLQAVIDHLVEIDAVESDLDHPQLADEVLSSVCKLNRIVQITEAMLLAVEALATRENLQLPGICLPELYERYAKTFHQLQQAESLPEMDTLANAIGIDIAALWNAMRIFGENGLQKWPEMANLWTIWRNQYDLADCSSLCASALIWQPVNCLRCKQEGKMEHPP
ncbi:MAG: transposase [Anaerolineaceae bacterium]|nr:transposase [Anaerolineaceae bacterium]